MTIEEKSLWKAASDGDDTAKAALADYYDERNRRDDTAAALGLRYCLLHKKWPTQREHRVSNLGHWGFWRERRSSKLPVALHFGGNYHRSAQDVVRRLGRCLLQMKRHLEGLL